MNSPKQLEAFQVVMKKSLREKGIHFGKDMTEHEIRCMIRSYNRENILSEHLTRNEFYELYLKIMKELVAEHFAMIETKITKTSKDLGSEISSPVFRRHSGYSLLERTGMK